MRLVGVASVAAGLACPVSASAQALRGDVRAIETNIPLPYSTIVLQPGVVGRFANDSGFFAFPELALGSYRVVVRAIGYLPFDTTITVAAEPIVLHVRLPPLAVELPPVTIVATRACLRPGPPSPDSEPELAAIFDQLRENAARYRLLSDAYPFRYWVEREQWSDPLAGDTAMVVDTLEFWSHPWKPYKPGGLIINRPGPQGRPERTLRLPTLIDLADSVFHEAHCFGFAGIDSLHGRGQLRVDFLAAERLRTPDVAGSAWLDVDTYQLRHLVFRLTRPEKVQRSLRTLEATVGFGDLLTAVTVPVHTEATSERKRGRQTVTAYERQRILRVEFLNARPGSQSP